MGRLLFKFRRQNAKSFPETFGKIGRAAKADVEGDFCDVPRLLFQQLLCALQSHGAEKLAGRLIGQRPQFAMQLLAAHVDQAGNFFNR